MDCWNGGINLFNWKRGMLQESYFWMKGPLRNSVYKQESDSILDNSKTLQILILISSHGGVSINRQIRQLCSSCLVFDDEKVIHILCHRVEQYFNKWRMSPVHRTFQCKSVEVSCTFIVFDHWWDTLFSTS